MRVLAILVISLAALASGSFAAPFSVSAPSNLGRLVLEAPRAEYPLEARRRLLAGRGVYVLRIHIPSGRVTQVVVGRSTGTRVLDEAAVKALLRWRFKPGAVPYTRTTPPFHISPPLTRDETLARVPMQFSLGT
jgi:TonB family protein